MRVVALDLTRFFAALSVVFYHYAPKLNPEVYPLINEVCKFGYLGVPLFFIISGYVISMSANNRTAMQFAVSRFVRLYPSLWAGVLFTTLIVTVFLGQKYSLTQVLANFTLVNEYLGFEDVDGVYWTLKAELKFYACIFLLLLFGVYKKYHIWLGIWLGITALHAVTGQPFFMGWFITPGYSSFFIAGIAYFLIQTEGRNPFNHTVLLISLIISSLKAFEQTPQFMQNPDTIDKILAVGFVWLFYLFFYLLCTGKISLRERRIFFTLGALTYPLYLIHNVAGKTIINQFSASVPIELMVVLTILIMLAVSLSIHKFIERPIATPLKKLLLTWLMNVKFVANRDTSS